MDSVVYWLIMTYATLNKFHETIISNKKRSNTLVTTLRVHLCKYVQKYFPCNWSCDRILFCFPLYSDVRGPCSQTTPVNGSIFFSSSLFFVLVIEIIKCFNRLYAVAVLTPDCFGAGIQSVVAWMTEALHKSPWIFTTPSLCSSTLYKQLHLQ